MTPHSLDIRCLHCGVWARAGQGICPLGAAVGTGRRLKQCLWGSHAVRPGQGPSRLPGSSPHSLHAWEHFLPLSPLLAFQSFYLFTHFDQPRPSEFFFHVTKQFITKTNGQNRSHLKHNPSIRRINSTEAADGCQVLYFTWFTKVLFVQYECVNKLSKP